MKRANEWRPQDETNQRASSVRGIETSPDQNEQTGNGQTTDKLLREVDDGTSAPSKTLNTIATAAELMFEPDRQAY
jgi:hypothetical protein